MVSNRALYALALLLFIAVSSCAQNKSPDEPWFFIQITDPQFGMFESNTGFEKETVLYEKAVEKINKLKPDFVVITGDFVHNSGSLAQIEEFKRITLLIDSKIPVYYTPGNHDVGQVPDYESLRNYVNNYGSDKFSFRHKRSVFIGFNTSLIKGRLDKQEQEQYNWLASEIRGSQGSKHIILFCHYPFFNKTVDEPTAYSNIDFDYRKKYLDLFNDNNVKAVFSGHHHNNGLTIYGKIQLVTTSALGKPLGNAPSGVRIVKIYNNIIEHNYYGLDVVPDSVNF